MSNEEPLIGLAAELGLMHMIRPEYLDLCEVAGCETPAMYEGWYRKLDPFLGTPTGLIQRRRVCDEHAHLLIGGSLDEPKDSVLE